MEEWLGGMERVGRREEGDEEDEMGARSGRVAVLHCKAGKGRSGTVACSFLVTAQGWSVERALGRFTKRRMRAGWGDGVSIKSQRRWIEYVARWAADGRRYDEDGESKSRRRVKVVEVRLWGMRDNVSVAIRGFVDGGKKIEVLQEWTDKDADTLPLEEGVIESKSGRESPASGASTPKSGKGGSVFKNGFIKSPPSMKSPASGSSGATAASYFQNYANPPPATLSILRPTKPIVLPTLDVNIEVEKRNRNFTNVVTSTAHSWFNVYFQGNGPENHGTPESSGVYSVEWDSMDGLKGSSRRGVRAAEKVAVVWKIVGGDEAEQAERERKEKEKMEDEIKTTEEKEREQKDREEQERSQKEAEARDSDSDEEGVQTYGVEGDVAQS
jgi:protein-tyrosine phosphatase